MSTPPTPKTSLLRRISSDLGISLQVLEVLIGIIGVIVAIVIPIAIYQLSKPNPNPTPSSTSPVPVTPPTPPSSPPVTPTPPTTTTTEPEPVAVRRTTIGKHPLTLTHQYAADLDSMDPGWAVADASGQSDWDIQFQWDELVGGDSDIAVVTGPAKYETCQDATGYSLNVDPKYVEAGTDLCVRTSQQRFAFVTIKDVKSDPGRIVLDVTVWQG